MIDMEDRIGFVGIGQMGFPMARNVLEAGFPVTACDVREEALAAFEELGGDVAATPREAARGAAGAHVMVVDDDQVNAVVRGEDGIFAGFEERGGGTLVIHSTVLPGTVADLAAGAPEDVAVIDAAVSGAKSGAEAGELSLMVGGDAGAVEAYRPALEPVAHTVYHLGRIGAGLATKLGNNLIFHANEAATLEAIALGEEYGVEREDLLSVFTASSGDNFFARNFEFYTGQYLSTHPAGPHGPARNAKKNLFQALELANDADVDVPVTALVSQLVPPKWHELAEKMED